MGSYSAAQVFAWLVLTLGTAAIVGSIVTPYWSSHGSVGYSYHRGLYETCRSGDLSAMGLEVSFRPCTNRLMSAVEAMKDDPGRMAEEISRNGNITDLDVWEIIVLVLLGASALFGALAVIMAPCCCHKCGCCLGSIVLIASMCAFSGIATYVYQTQSGQNRSLEQTVTDVTSPLFQTNSESSSNYSYSFYAAAAGALCQFVTSVLFCVARSRETVQYSGI